MAKNRISFIKPYLLPRLQDILFLAIFVAVLLLGPRMLNQDGDLQRHLATGRFIAQTGTVPTTELFAYPLAGKPFVATEWLAELILYFAYTIFGLSGTVLLSALLLATSFTLLYIELSSRLDSRIPLIFLVGGAAVVSSLHWIVRPYLFSMLFLVICLIWTDRLVRGKKLALWRLPVLMGIWVNVHGEFIAGILIILAYIAGWLWDFLFNRTSMPDGKWKILLTLLLSILASFITPTGFNVLLAISGFVGNRYIMSRMGDTSAPNFQDPSLYALLVFVAFSIFLLSITTKRISTGRSALLAGFTIMVLTSIRNIHLYGLVAPFVLAEPLVNVYEVKLLERVENSLRAIETQLRGGVWPIVAIVVLGSFVLFHKDIQRYYRFDPTFSPIEAVNWLENHPQHGNMFNDLNWGGYIDLRLGPEHPVFLDSVADLSGNLTREYETVITLSNGWQDTLTKYNVAWVIIPTESLLAHRLVSDPHWGTMYNDSIAVILRKK